MVRFGRRRVGPWDADWVTTAPLVRPAVADDAAAMREIYAPEVSGGFATFEYDVPSVEEFVRRIHKRPRLPWLVAEVDRTVGGYAYASTHRDRPAYRWSTECSVYISNEHQGQRLGRALYEVLIPAVRDLGYVTMYSGIAPPNEASVGLHKAFGFELIGTYPNVGYKLNAWRDVEWYSLALTDAPPASPTAPAEWSGRLA